MRCTFRMTARSPHFVRITSVATVLGLVILGLGSGCRKGIPNGLVPVSGHVRLDGRPLEGASITFRSEREQYPALTDAEGRYELRPGAAPGDYRVTVGKLEGSAEAMLAADPAAAGHVPASHGPVGTPKQAVPTRYSDPQTSELRFMVAEPGTTRADFDLVTTPPPKH
jgi:hypothetical protein